jgi:mRNA interferase RelE/StbE
VSYRVIIGRTAQRQLARLSKPVREQAERHIDGLADDPRPWGAEALSGTLRPLRKLRVGDYRVAYRVDDEARLVTVVWAGHRNRIYEELERKQ